MDVWDLTLDEVGYALRGRVDDLRLQRKAVLLIGMFEKGTMETDLYELPFDDELTGKEVDLVEEYNKNKWW